MERETVGVLEDKVVSGKGYRVEWATDTLVPVENFTEYYIQSPPFKLWGFDVRLKIDINQFQKYCENITVTIRLSPHDPKAWVKLCEGTKSFLSALYSSINSYMSFDNRIGQGDILITSPNVFRCKFEHSFNKETGTPQLKGNLQIKFMIEKPEKEFSLERAKASLERLHGFQHLSNQLGRLLENPENSDLTIQCGNQEFPVHKFILSARSTALKKLMGELEEDILDLDMVKDSSIDPRVVKLVLEWIYTGVMKDKGDLLADISALARIWGLEKLARYSTTLADMNYRLENPEVIGEIEPPPKKKLRKSKTHNKDYNLVLGNLKVIPWIFLRMEWKMDLPKFGLDEGMEFHSPPARFFGVDWSLLMKVSYSKNVSHDQMLFQISLEPTPSALQNLGFEVGAEPKLLFSVKYYDPAYYYNEKSYTAADYSNITHGEDCNCTECLDSNRINRMGINKYKFSEYSSIVNRLNEKKPKIKIDWMVQIEFKSGLLADKMKKEIKRKEEFIEDLVLDLGSLLDDPKDSDVVLRCEGKDFQAHKVILAAQSPVFKVMLETPMKESLESVIEVRDVHGELVGGDVVGAILRWMYKRELEELDEGQTLITLGLAEFYNLIKLKELCEVKLKGLIRDENVVDILIMADFVRAEGLKREAIQFINKNKSISKTEEFKEKVGWDLFQDIFTWLDN